RHRRTDPGARRGEAVHGAGQGVDEQGRRPPGGAQPRREGDGRDARRGEEAVPGDGRRHLEARRRRRADRGQGFAGADAAARRPPPSRPPPGGGGGRLRRLARPQPPAGDKPVTLEHAWLGRVTLPANRTVSVWQLPGLLSDEGQKKLNKDVQAALEGDEDAADRLELVLPFAHAAMRAAVAESPKAKLAPRLRMMLALFDDTVMPVLVPPKAESPFGPGSGFGGPGGPPRRRQPAPSPPPPT